MEKNSRKKPPLRKRKLEMGIYAAIALLVVIILIVVICVVNGSKTHSDDVSSQPSEGKNVSVVDVSSAASEHDVSTEESESESTPESSAETSSSSVSSSEASVAQATATGNNKNSEGDYIDYTVSGSEETSQWYLRLVNYENLMPDSWRPTDLKTIDNEGRKIDSRAYAAYKDLTAAAKAAGVSLSPISGYRTYDTQNTLFRNRVSRVYNDYPDYTEEQAENEASRHVARPNTSDHEIGLAVDFNSVEESFENTSAGKWLAANCTEYGFVLRYPKDKQDITKVTYEPWHFRFVGVKHAKAMKSLGMCLEEYTDYLKSQG